MGPPPGGGFLQGALGTAAGVAGGVLLADSIRNLFGGHYGGLGIASGIPGMGGGETIVNNYYEDPGQGDIANPGDTYDETVTYDDNDPGSDFGGGGDDGTYDV